MRASICRTWITIIYPDCTARAQWLKGPLQRVASILTRPQVGVTSANQTNPSSRPHMCIMQCGSWPLKPAVREELLGLGTGPNAPADLIPKIKSCDLTGIWLYLPNMSID